MNEGNQKYRWYILLLVALTDMFVIAIPTMGMSVLAREIADDLSLNLVRGRFAGNCHQLARRGHR